MLHLNHILVYRGQMILKNALSKAQSCVHKTFWVPEMICQINLQLFLVIFQIKTQNNRHTGGLFCVLLLFSPF